MKYPKCPGCGGRVLIIRDVGKGHRLRVTEDGNVQPGSVVTTFSGEFRWNPICENVCGEELEYDDFGFVPMGGFIMDSDMDGDER